MSTRDIGSILLAYAIVGLPVWIGVILIWLRLIPVWSIFVVGFALIPWAYLFKRWARGQDGGSSS